jgi:hypothetical protein
MGSPAGKVACSAVTRPLVGGAVVVSGTGAVIITVIVAGIIISVTGAAVVAGGVIIPAAGAAVAIRKGRGCAQGCGLQENGAYAVNSQGEQKGEKGRLVPHR